jgi:hypothetical protein
MVKSYFLSFTDFIHIFVWLSEFVCDPGPISPLLGPARTYNRIYIDIDILYVLPNVVVECLTLLLRIREVPFSNLGYPD